MVAPVRYSRETIDALRGLGSKPIYTEYQSGTHFDPNEHVSWIYTYANKALREWFFRQAKP